MLIAKTSLPLFVASHRNDLLTQSGVSHERIRGGSDRHHKDSRCRDAGDFFQRSDRSLRQRNAIIGMPSSVNQGRASSRLLEQYQREMESGRLTGNHHSIIKPARTDSNIPAAIPERGLLKRHAQQ